ncbi:MAG: hypothetical protein J7K47_03135 [Thermoplasmata archaeon]|nr:hypothetical protein [Thermoplasmata archaeon]
MKEIKIKLSWELVLSIIAILAGIVYYIAWGVHYHVWADLGIYSVTAFLVSLGVLGSMASIFKSS